MKPSVDQLEMTLIGPGYGESIVLHVGNGQWVVIDSCIESTTSLPAAITYLESLSVDPAEAVKLIVATHWHDDHVRGMGALVSSCPQAKFCCSSALNRVEFLSMVRRFEKDSTTKVGSGVREINNVFKILTERNELPIFAGRNQLVMRLDVDDTRDERECRIWTLSPSDEQYWKFLFEMASLMPMLKQTKYRCVPQQPNHLSLVSWIEMGEAAILLGADLEETKEAGTGWSVIVASAERPQGRASVLKIPHHGSANAHCDEVWHQMLVNQAHAVLTPWNRGAGLPTNDDIQRILELTRHAYSSARIQLPRARQRNPTVKRQLREMGAKIRSVEPPTGRISLRNGGISDPTTWTVELSPEACHLSQARPAG